MKHHIVAVAGIVGLLLNGCSLPVPKTSIVFQPATRTLNILSPKDVQIEALEVMSEGTNFTLTVKGYKSANPVEVIKAAAGAQAVQIQAAQQTLEKVISAAAGVK